MVISNLSVISDLDRTLEQLFLLEFGNPLTFDLSFALPDKNFKPLSQTRSTLNCYLYEINEDRELRNIEPILRRNADGTIDRLPAPTRVKLSYCITAWSPAQATPAGGPELDEHTLLSLALQVRPSCQIPARPPAISGAPLEDSSDHHWNTKSLSRFPTSRPSVVR